MNPGTKEEAINLARKSDNVDLIICPPFVFIEDVRRAINASRLGAQDVFWEKGVGAYTGEVSVRELKSSGVEYVLVGHSERRRVIGETNEIVAKKLKAVINGGLVPVLLVGETAEEKEAGQRNEVLSQGIKSALENIGIPTRIYIAYEPIWAISTNKKSKADDPESTVEAIKVIKKAIKSINKEILEHAHFIYGGSITPANANDFLQHKEIEGAVVGGASLDPESIQKIIEIVDQY